MEINVSLIKIKDKVFIKVSFIVVLTEIGSPLLIIIIFFIN